MRRHFEDLFQAAAAALGGLFLVWVGIRLRSGGPSAALSVNSLADLQEAAGLAACAVGLLVLAWWVVGFAAALLSAVLARCGSVRAARAVGLLSPGFHRRLLAAALGIQLIAGPVPAALAVTSVPTGTAGAVAVTHPARADAQGSAVDPMWQLEPDARPGESAPVDPAWKPAPDPVSASLLIPPGIRKGESSQETVTVVSGDTLWDLAAAQLGSLATDVEVAEVWPQWYELNRMVIGPDPDILLPGQILMVPPLPAG